MSSTVKLKTATFNIKNKEHCNIFDLMSSYSKNVYNCTIFNTTIYTKNKQRIFKLIYDKINNLTDEQKKEFDIHSTIYKLYDNIYNEYVENIPIIRNNSKIIYNFIKEYIDQSYVINDYYNVMYEIVKYNSYKNKDIIYNNLNKSDVIDCIIKSILQSIYNKNYYRTYYQLINKEPITIENTDFIEQVKNNEHLFNSIKQIDWKKKIEKDFKLKICSDNNIIGRVTYSHLKENKDLLPSDLIINIIQKAYKGYSSFYALKNKGIRANMPKYIDKKGHYILPFYTRSFKVTNNMIRLTVGENISLKYNEIVKNNKLVCLNSNSTSEYKYYVSKTKLKPITKKKISSSKNHIINNKYIEKDNKNIINGYYVYIKIPKYIKENNIKLIEIKPLYDNHSYKICITYEQNSNIINISNINPVISDSISIDLGMKNLMTIYDPSNKQYIIKGGYLLWLNKRYNYLIDNLKSKAKKYNDKNTTKQIRNLLIDRENKINDFFNNIVKWISEKYKNKKLIIIGYNKQWKDRISLNKDINRKFYQIPYCRLLDKLNDKLTDKGIKVSYNEESYTSKCDALSLEEICKHEHYNGKRIKRGLFSSSKNKLINADLNGAINIMRKYFGKNEIIMTDITGTNICNPLSVKLLRKVVRPA